jgi:phosphatidylglycerol:prolipoprotein diacylglycerol transferase
MKMNIFVFPYINPVAFSLGPLSVKWYGLMYLLAFLAAWGLAHYRVKKYDLNWDAEQVADLIFYGAMGAIIGGRLGYMLFYDLHQFMKAPWVFFKIWQGGMSFHGGLLGVLVSVILFAKKSKKQFLEVTDFMAPLVPIGLGLGRLGNFINGELWGRPTDKAWGVVFPYVDGQARHPSQLYEFALEGILLFIVIWVYASKPRAMGKVSALFLIVYGLCRFFVEFFRQPDAQLGYIALNWLTMGQLLSLPMIAAGIILWWVKR